jgi:predicted O-methyltransferase YrrM
MDKLSEYIESFFGSDNPVLDRIAEEYETRDDVIPNIGLQTGKFLAWLIRLTKARKAMEFGTCIGYSTIVLAEALLENDGDLISIEADPDYFKETKKNVEAAGLSKTVTLVHGDAGVEVDNFSGPFDLILQDSDKALYPKMLAKCIEKTKTGGIIVADDALFKPLGVAPEQSRPIHEYNQKVFADGKLVSTILPIGDGLTVSIKVA